MVLAYRHAAVALAALAAVAGCNQSLFDANGDDTVKADDQVPPTVSCPAPCEGDAVADWNGNQGGSNGRWRYLDDMRDRAWVDMTPGNYLDELFAMVGAGADPDPAIANCVEQRSPRCSGHEQSLLVFPSGFQGMHRDPSIEFTVPGPGTYLVSGEMVSAGGGTGEQSLLFYRNTREDLVHRVAYATTNTDAQGFAVEIDALEGDRILVALGLNAATEPVPLALRLFVSRATTVSRCQMAVRFSEAIGPAFSEECAPFDYISRRYVDEDYQPLVSPTFVESVLPRFSHALKFEQGDYFFPGSTIDTPGPALDYSGDFTIQFWSSFPSGYSFTSGRFFADLNDNGTSGTDFLVGSEGLMEIFFAHGAGPENATSLLYQLPDLEWHHIRIVRDTEINLVRVCLDGIRVAQAPFPASLNPAGVHAPYLGRSPTATISYFTGTLDDVRVLSRALPCL